MGRITHIVMFSFKAAAEARDIKATMEHIVSLKEKCVHPATQRTYMVSARCGADNSPEGVQRGITHVCVMEFESAADRGYYLDEDPAHDEFKRRAGPLLEIVQVVDFEAGVV